MNRLSFISMALKNLRRWFVFNSFKHLNFLLHSNFSRRTLFCFLEEYFEKEFLLHKLIGEEKNVKNR